MKQQSQNKDSLKNKIQTLSNTPAQFLYMTL